MPPKRAAIPKHLGETAEEWRRRKRREWQAVIKAMHVYRLGCAYTPDAAYKLFNEIEEKAKTIQQDLRGNWVAWEDFRRAA